MPPLIEKKALKKIDPEYSWVFTHASTLEDDIIFLPNRPSRGWPLFYGIAFLIGVFILWLIFSEESVISITREGVSLDLSGDGAFTFVFMMILFIPAFFGAVRGFYKFFYNRWAGNLLDRKLWRRGIFLFSDAMLYSEGNSWACLIPVNHITGFHKGNEVLEKSRRTFIYATYVNSLKEETSLELKGDWPGSGLPDLETLRRWLEKNRKQPVEYSRPEGKEKKESSRSIFMGLCFILVGLAWAGWALWNSGKFFHAALIQYREVRGTVISSGLIEPEKTAAPKIHRIHYKYTFNGREYNGTKDFSFYSEESAALSLKEKAQGAEIKLYVDQNTPSNILLKLEEYSFLGNLILLIIGGYGVFMGWMFLMGDESKKKQNA